MRGDELVGELLARRVDDALARELGDDLVADGVHQVGLAEADAAVQEQRVVGVAGPLRHGQAGRVGEPVGRADDEVRERVARVEVGRAALAADPRRLDPDLLAARPTAATAPRPARPVRRRRLRRRSDDEFDLDAVAHDPGQRLADQRAVAGLQPVLGEPVRDGDPEALLVDIDQLRIAQPRLEIRRRQRHLELSEGGSPDLLGVHSFDGILRCDDRSMGSVGHGSGSPSGSRASRMLPSLAPVRDGPEDPDRVLGGSRERLRRRGPGEDSTGRRRRRKAILRYPRGVSAARPDASAGPAPGQPGGTRPSGPRSAAGRGGLTLFSAPAYHPATTTRRALSGARRVCVPSGEVTDRPRGRMERIPDHPDESRPISPRSATAPRSTAFAPG